MSATAAQGFSSFLDSLGRSGAAAAAAHGDAHVFTSLPARHHLWVNLVT